MNVSYLSVDINDHSSFWYFYCKINAPAMML